MKDEIKEILEDYKKLAGEITEKLDNTAEYESWLIVQDYFDKLLDYITNLQEENDKLTAESTEWEERTYCWQDRAEDLEIIIEKLKKKIERQKHKMFKSHNKIALYILLDLEKTIKGEDKE